MKIEQLTVENFKCFKREQTFDFSRLTILTGANSSGKSSVIYAILMALQSEGFPNSLSTNGNYVNLGDFKDISNNHKKNNIIKLGFKVQELLFKDISPTVIIKTNWKEDKVDLLPKLSNFEATNENEVKFDKDDILSIFFEANKTNQSFNFISAFRQAPRRTYLEKNKADFKIETDGEGYIDQIVEWDKRSNGKIKQLIKTMKALDLIEDIKINRLGGGRFEVLIKPLNSNDFSALNDVGSGVSAFMPIIVADLQLHDSSTLFLAEPEIHLHPSVQAKFIDYIVHKIKTTDKNYVIETHSEYFLNRIRLAIVKEELKKESIKVYFLENTKEDTNVFDVDFTTTGAIKNAPKTFFKTYMMDVMDIALNAQFE
jgi:predicted ATPase